MPATFDPKLAYKSTRKSPNTQPNLKCKSKLNALAGWLIILFVLQKPDTERFVCFALIIMLIFALKRTSVVICFGTYVRELFAAFVRHDQGRKYRREKRRKSCYFIVFCSDFGESRMELWKIHQQKNMINWVFVYLWFTAQEAESFPGAEAESTCNLYFFCK